MAKSNRQASLNFYDGANGPTLMFLIHEDADLSALKAILLGLAQGEASKVSLRSAGVVEFACAIDDLVFVRIIDEHEPSRTVQKVQDTLLGHVFEFRRYKTIWLGCADYMVCITWHG